MGIVWLAIIGSVIWVGIDANNLGMKRGKLGGGPIDMGVASWVLCCLFLWIISFPCYLVARSKYKALPAAGAWQGYGAPVAQADPWQQPVQQQAPQWSAPAMGTTVVPAAAVTAAPAAPPQYSPDGHWWWNGQEWVPAQR
jgi:hypothetical protein